MSSEKLHCVVSKLNCRIVKYVAPVDENIAWGMLFSLAEIFFILLTAVRLGSERRVGDRVISPKKHVIYGLLNCRLKDKDKIADRTGRMCILSACAALVF